MESSKVKFTTVKEYISTFPAKDKRLLEEVRKIIKKAAPDAEEVISYGMPAFKQDGMLIFYAGCKEHIGIYPASMSVAIAFKKELESYVKTKGSIHFPKDKPIPTTLLTKIVKYRVQENKEKAKAKLKKKK